MKKLFIVAMVSTMLFSLSALANAAPSGSYSDDGYYRGGYYRGCGGCGCDW